jgi:hypothetical protein
MSRKPILPLCVCGNPLCKIPYGYCHCGCGNKVRLATHTSVKWGRIEGFPVRFVSGRNAVQHRLPIRYGKIDGEPVAYIPLTQGYWAIIDRCKLYIIKDQVWFYRNGYACRSCGGRILQMHNVVMPPPEGLETDHRFGKTLDNRCSQLRCGTHGQNMCNQTSHRRNNTSGYKGVICNGYGWEVLIGVNGKRVYIGCFPKDQLIEAAKAYDVAAIRYHGEYARLNFPVEVCC